MARWRRSRRQGKVMNLKNNTFTNLIRAIITPFSFSWNSGHFLATLTGRGCDSQGRPLPKYTYPAVDLLLSKQYLMKDWSVLEFGAGYSTLWWEQRVRRVVSMERSPKWAEIVQQRLTRPQNVQLIHAESDEAFLAVPSGEKFNVIIVDAQPRIKAAELARELLAEGGVIIVDNSDHRSLAPMCDMLRSSNFKRVDFYGYSAGAYFKQCTSFYFLEDDFWLTPEPVMGISSRSLRE